MSHIRLWTNMLFWLFWGYHQFQTRPFDWIGLPSSTFALFCRTSTWVVCLLPLLINWHMNIWHIPTSGYIWVNLQPAVHDFESKLHRIPDPSSPRVGPPSSICLWVCSGPSRHLYSTHPGAKQREKGCCPDAAGLSDCYQWESPK